VTSASGILRRSASRVRGRLGGLNAGPGFALCRLRMRTKAAGGSRGTPCERWGGCSTSASTRPAAPWPSPRSTSPRCAPPCRAGARRLEPGPGRCPTVARVRAVVPLDLERLPALHGGPRCCARRPRRRQRLELGGDLGRVDAHGRITPGTFRASESSTLRIRPPKTGGRATTAWSIPSTRGVDAVDGRAVVMSRLSTELDRVPPDVAELRGLLQPHGVAGGDRQGGGGGRELAVGDRPAGGRVASPRGSPPAPRPRADAPAGGGRLLQHGPRRGADPGAAA
jgi:hypothetical protein